MSAVNQCLICAWVHVCLLHFTVQTPFTLGSESKYSAASVQLARSSARYTRVTRWRKGRPPPFYISLEGQTLDIFYIQITHYVLSTYTVNLYRIPRPRGHVQAFVSMHTDVRPCDRLCGCYSAQDTGPDTAKTAHWFHTAVRQCDFQCVDGGRRRENAT